MAEQTVIGHQRGFIPLRKIRLYRACARLAKEHEEALTLEPWFCLGLRVQLQSCYIMLKYVDTTIAQLYACRVWAWCGHSTDAEDSILQIGEDEVKQANEEQKPIQMMIIDPYNWIERSQECH